MLNVAPTIPGPGTSGFTTNIQANSDNAHGPWNAVGQGSAYGSTDMNSRFKPARQRVGFPPNTGNMDNFDASGSGAVGGYDSTVDPPSRCDPQYSGAQGRGPVGYDMTCCGLNASICEGATPSKDHHHCPECDAAAAAQNKGALSNTDFHPMTGISTVSSGNIGIA